MDAETSPSVEKRDFNPTDYDEFAALDRNAAYEGIAWNGRPPVERRAIELADGRQLSAIVWGTETPALVCLHGAGQNAHTWDSMSMVLQRPLIAIDLPGHGHSDWREDGDYRPTTNAEAIAETLDHLSLSPEAIIGMSLGGLTAIALATLRSDLVKRAVLVDVTPNISIRSRVLKTEERGAAALMREDARFDSFDAMLTAAAATQPHRPIESLRVGVLHNSRQLDDGRWTWRYDWIRRGEKTHDPGDLWDDLVAMNGPVMLVKGGNSPYVHEDDCAELVRRKPGSRVEIVEGASHSVQSSRASRLAALIADFLASN